MNNNDTVIFHKLELKSENVDDNLCSPFLYSEKIPTFIMFSNLMCKRARGTSSEPFILLL